MATGKNFLTLERRVGRRTIAVYTLVTSLPIEMTYGTDKKQMGKKLAFNFKVLRDMFQAQTSNSKREHILLLNVHTGPFMLSISFYLLLRL